MGYRSLTGRWFATRRGHFLVIATLSAILLLARLHQGDLSGYDDAVYAHEGREMLLTGDWWSVYYNGYLAFENPPGFIWLEALSMRIFGISDFAAKFPAALLGLGIIILTYLIICELSDQFWLPIISMLVLASTQYFMKYATHAMLDVPFTFFVTLAIFSYVKGYRQPKYFLLCGLSIGLGILIRSVLGLIPLGIIGAHGIINDRYRVLRSSYGLGGLFLALFLPCIWYTSQYQLYGHPFLFVHFSFVLAKVSSGKVQTSWNYLYNWLKYPRLLSELYWPWLPFMLVGFWDQINVIRRRKDALASLLVIWVVLTIVPMSVAEAKILRYIMPAFPAFSILAAIPLAKWSARVQTARFFKTGYIAFYILAFVFIALPIHRPRLRAQDMRTLAPIAEGVTDPKERVLLYTYGEPRWDYKNQLLWYGYRYCEHLTNRAELKQRLQQGRNRTVILDKASYAQLAGTLGLTSKIVGESENFLCLHVGPVLSNARLVALRDDPPGRPYILE